MLSPALKKILAFGILAVVALGGIAIYLLQVQGGTKDANVVSGTATVIKADHYFENGLHTYKGTIAVPTPCHDVISTVTVMESYPEQVLIDLKKEGASNFCAQVISQAPFEATFQASKDARISVTLDGEPAQFKVTEKIGGAGGSVMPVSVASTTEGEIFDDSFLYEGSAVE